MSSASIGGWTGRRVAGAAMLVSSALASAAFVASILSSSYRRARLLRILHDPAVAFTASPVLVFAMVFAFAILVTGLALVVLPPGDLAREPRA